MLKSKSLCFDYRCMFVTNSPGTIMLLYLYNHQEPVVQSIVSVTISLRHKFFKQISAKVTNTLLFFVEKMLESFAVQRILTFFQQKITVFVILMFEILTKR